MSFETRCSAKPLRVYEDATGGTWGQSPLCMRHRIAGSCMGVIPFDRLASTAHEPSWSDPHLSTKRLMRTGQGLPVRRRSHSREKQ